MTCLVGLIPARSKATDNLDHSLWVSIRTQVLTNRTQTYRDVTGTDDTSKRAVPVCGQQ
jgi:hypothetical protein